MASKRNVNIRIFARVTTNGDIVPGSIIPRRRMPKTGGNWIELTANQCCPIDWTTTTTTTTSTTTTTT